jgi:hypothetical protein
MLKATADEPRHLAPSSSHSCHGSCWGPPPPGSTPRSSTGGGGEREIERERDCPAPTRPRFCSHPRDPATPPRLHRQRRSKGWAWVSTMSSTLCSESSSRTLRSSRVGDSRRSDAILTLLAAHGELHHRKSWEPAAWESRRQWMRVGPALHWRRRRRRRGTMRRWKRAVPRLCCADSGEEGGPEGIRHDEIRWARLCCAFFTASLTEGERGGGGRVGYVGGMGGRAYKIWVARKDEGKI